MASIRQIEANRRNAAKSTGPRTEEGKARSSANALKHGMTAIHLSLPHEDPELFAQTLDALLETWQPADSAELQLVHLIASSWLGMQRAERMRVSLMDGMLRTVKARNGRKTDAHESDDLGLGVIMGDPDNDRAWKNIDRYYARAQGGYFRALEALRKMQADRLARPARKLKHQRDTAAWERASARSNPLNSTVSTQMGSFEQKKEPLQFPALR